MNRVELTRCLMGVPNSDKPIAMTGRMFHRIVRDLQSTIVQNVNGSPATRTPFGASIFTRRGGAGSSSTFPFKVVTNGYTEGSEPKPIIKVLAGYIITASSDGGEPSYDLVDDTTDTLSGGATTGFKAWLDLQSLSIDFGADWPLEADIDKVPNRFRYLHLATFDTSAEHYTGPNFIPSAISNIEQIWSGNVIQFFMPEHDHSRTGKGGNKIELTDDPTDGTGAAPWLKVGNGNGVEDVLFTYDDSGTTKRGLWGRYQS